jgi:hypothetical protein
MPDFRMRNDCRQWFSHIIGPGTPRTLFDGYYLCFLLGVSTRHTSIPTDAGPAPVFVDGFVRPYDVCQRLLIGLMIDAELSGLGVEPTDRASVNRVVSDLAGPGGLTPDGARRMDGYASGGYDLLIERYDEDEPRTFEEFLPRYLRILAAAAAGEVAA